MGDNRYPDRKDRYIYAIICFMGLFFQFCEIYLGIETICGEGIIGIYMKGDEGMIKMKNLNGINVIRLY
jgi:hypothetical protein